MSATDPRQALAALYRERLAIDRRIERAEAEIAFLRTAGQQPRRRIEHGDESAYQRHIRKRIPFPEDFGMPACGCRLAHRRYEAKRAERVRGAAS